MGDDKKPLSTMFEGVVTKTDHKYLHGRALNIEEFIELPQDFFAHVRQIRTAENKTVFLFSPDNQIEGPKHLFVQCKLEEAAQIVEQKNGRPLFIAEQARHGGSVALYKDEITSAQSFYKVKNLSVRVAGIDFDLKETDGLKAILEQDFIGLKPVEKPVRAGVYENEHRLPRDIIAFSRGQKGNTITVLYKDDHDDECHKAVYRTSEKTMAALAQHCPGKEKSDADLEKMRKTFLSPEAPAH